MAEVQSGAWRNGSCGGFGCRGASARQEGGGGGEDSRTRLTYAGRCWGMSKFCCRKRVSFESACGM